jgi:DNA-binding Lrp family transcriptional regulator
LSTTARDVAEVLNTAPSKYGECWLSTERIAELIGKSVATVLKKLRELELKGLIARVVDYGLKTRRRIVLLWREQPNPEPVEETMSHAGEPTDAPGVAPHAEAPRAQEPRETPQASPRKATAEEVDALVKRASKLGSPSRRWVTDVARKYGVRLTSKAVDHAVAKGKTRFGWVCEAVKAWTAEGVPTHLEDDADVDRRISHWDKQAEDIRRIFGPGGTCPFKPENVAPTFVNDSIDGTWKFWKDEDHAKYERRLEL